MFAQPPYHVYKISFATSEEGLRTPAVIEYFETLGHLSNSIAQLFSGDEAKNALHFCLHSIDSMIQLGHFFKGDPII